MNQLPVQRASELSIDSAALTHWLVQGLWSDQAVGILGGEPKCCKSFLALDLAVSVASGTHCLRQFPVHRTGPVAPVSRRRLPGGGAPAFGGDLLGGRCRLPVSASGGDHRPDASLGRT